MQVPCSSAQEASFLGKPIAVQGHACREEQLPSPGPFSLQNGTEKESPIKLQIHLHWLLGANSNSPTVPSCAPKNNPPITTDSLEQIALVPPEELLCLTSIPLALCGPERNRLHREGQSCRHHCHHPACTAELGTG